MRSDLVLYICVRKSLALMSALVNVIVILIEMIIIMVGFFCFCFCFFCSSCDERRHNQYAVKSTCFFLCIDELSG